MSIANLLSQTLDGHDTVASWLEAALVQPIDGFVRQPGKRFRGRLTQIAWDLARDASSPAALPPELPQLLELLHAGSLIVDDIEDGSTERRGAPALHQSLGMPLALNAGNALYFLPVAGLESMGLSAQAELAIHRELARTMSRCHAGQALDLYATLDRVPAAEIPALVESIGALKTGSLMAAAARLGAIAAGASHKVVEALGRFGCDLGIALQVLDDLGNLGGRRDPAKHVEDLRTRRLTWAWAWLTRLATPERVIELRRRVVEQTCPLEETARELLATVGDHARADARERLHTAGLRLVAALGPSADLSTLFAEVQRLEASYG